MPEHKTRTLEEIKDWKELFATEEQRQNWLKTKYIPESDLVAIASKTQSVVQELKDKINYLIGNRDYEDYEKQIEKLQNEKKILYEDLLESNKKAETSHKNSLDRLDKIIILMKENARLKLILNNEFNYKED